MVGGGPFTSLESQRINRIILGVYTNYRFVSIQIKGLTCSALMVHEPFRYLGFSACGMPLD
jgi:hypothetical protein